MLYTIDNNMKKEIKVQTKKWGLAPGKLTVLVGPETASSGEILAALLRRYGGAELLGAPTAGKDYLSRVVAVDQDWRLLVPAERIEVPGETLAGGLVPDRLLPAALALDLGP
jgi:C-terminal processing protease CtpA/Prc